MAEAQPRTLKRENSKLQKPSLTRNESRPKEDYVGSIEGQPATLGREISRELVTGTRVAIVGIDHVEKRKESFEIKAEFNNEERFMEELEAKAGEWHMDIEDLEEHCKVFNNKGEQVEMEAVEDDESQYPLVWKYEPPVEIVDVNGQVGVLTALVDEANKNWQVHMDNGKDAIVSYRHLARLAVTKVLGENDLAVLVGLSEDPKRNGRIVVAKKFNVADKSWDVTMPDGSETRIAAENILCAETRTSFGELITINLTGSLSSEVTLGTVQLLSGSSGKELRNQVKTTLGQKDVLLSFQDQLIQNHEILQNVGLKNDSTVNVTILGKSQKIFEMIGEDLINSKREKLDPQEVLGNCELIGFLLTAAW